MEKEVICCFVVLLVPSGTSCDLAGNTSNVLLLFEFLSPYIFSGLKISTLGLPESVEIQGSLVGRVSIIVLSVN